MKTNELRIGNYVQITERIGFPSLKNSKYYQVSRIGNTFIRVEDDKVNDIEVSRNIKPIPLTEEILLKCGFDKLPFNNQFSINIGDTPCVAVKYEDGSVFFIGVLTLKNIDSFHQLQNLYFALTGEELEIKF